MRCSRDTCLTLALLALAAAAVAACSGDEKPTESSGESLSCEVGYEDFAGPFVLNWCVGCHSSSLVGEAERKKAPEGVDFDTLEGLRKYGVNARAFVVDLELMPPLGGPTREERELFGKWIDCGMPATSDGFDPPAPSGGPDDLPEPTGACAMPRQFLPDSAMPRCAAVTQTCVVQCGIDNPDYGADDCRNACLAADITPPADVGGLPVNCANCTLAQLLACSDQGGCHDETARFICCLEACAGDETCNQQCAGELQAFGLCVYYTAPHCVDYVDGPMGSCFAEGAVIPTGGAGGAPSSPPGGAGGSGGG